MSRAPAKNCNRLPGCSGVIRDGVCSVCGPKKAKWRESSAKRGYGYRWQKKVSRYKKENPLCCDPFNLHPGVDKMTEEVDHIIPKSQGGSDDESNLQPLCKSCHSTKTAGELFGGSTRYPKAQGRAVIVWGPPAGGKSSYVENQIRWGDVLVDVDQLYRAMSGQQMYDKPASLLPLVLSARDAIIYRLSTLKGQGLGTAWVITSNPNMRAVLDMAEDIGAEMHVIAPTRNQCIRNLMSDDRRQASLEHWENLINQWYQSNPERVGGGNH